MKNVALLLAMVLASASTAFSATGGQEGNGGGGVLHDGRYMTFYSAGLYTEPLPIAPPKIPSLMDTVSFINNFAFLSQGSKQPFLQALIPTTSRQYFRVREDKFDAATRARLISEFSRVTGQPTDALEIFAVTDTSSKTTYLLPSFFQLGQSDQMAILFHEAFWIVNPQSDYRTVIQAEVAFQAVLTDPKNFSWLGELIKYTGSEADRVNLAVEHDRTTGALTGVLQNGALPILALFGKEFFDCQIADAAPSRKPLWGYTRKFCADMIGTNLFFLQQKYPNSLVISLFQDVIAASGGRGVLIAGKPLIGDDYYSNFSWHSLQTCLISLRVDFSKSSSTYGLPLSSCDSDNYNQGQFVF